MYLAEFVSGLVVGALKGSGNSHAETIGRMAYGGVMFFAVSIVLHPCARGQEHVQRGVPGVNHREGL